MIRWQWGNHSIRQLWRKTMENWRRHHSRQKLDTRKGSKESASFVTSWWQTKGMRPEILGAGDRQQMSIKPKFGIPDLLVQRLLRRRLQPVTKNASPYQQIPYEKQTQDEKHNQRREIKGKMKHALKINQLTEDCGLDGQSEYEYEYEDDALLN